MLRLNTVGLKMVCQTCLFFTFHFLYSQYLVVVLDDASEEEREDLFLDTGTRRINSKRESRKEREEKLRKMMEGIFSMNIQYATLT